MSDTHGQGRIDGSAGDGSAAGDDGRCVSCGSPSATRFDTRDGRIWMCPSCAVINGIGCP